MNGTVPSTIRICDSATWSETGHRPEPGSDTVAIDPVLGRAYLPPTGELRNSLATFHYGAALNIGGGGYDRGDAPVPDEPPATVQAGAALQPALDTMADGGIVEIADSWRYEETPRLAPNVGAH